jgi:acetoin utilization deacetylase AcuC-like enzyme
MGNWHPESAARLQAIEDQLIASGLINYLDHYEAPFVQRSHLQRVHDAGYLDAVEKAAPISGLVHLDPDTAMGSGTLDAALRAAGAVILATDLVVEGRAETAFCSVRPPGHHAGRDRAMGFCFFNNVAVGAAHALAEHGLERVAIVDFDVHHGNGTEEIFLADERVLMVSTFQHPFYPYSGIAGRSERMVNVPLAAYSSGREFRAAVEEHWLPALERHRPEIIFVSAGFDAHRDDDMAMLGLIDADYAWVTERIKEAAEKSAHGKIVSSLEGGYDLPALGRSVAAHVKVLADL